MNALLKFHYIFLCWGRRSLFPLRKIILNLLLSTQYVTKIFFVVFCCCCVKGLFNIIEMQIVPLWWWETVIANDTIKCWHLYSWERDKTLVLLKYHWNISIWCFFSFDTIHLHHVHLYFSSSSLDCNKQVQILWWRWWWCKGYVNMAFYWTHRDP